MAKKTGAMRQETATGSVDLTSILGLVGLLSSLSAA
jgi:hypothetical protein